MIIIDMIERLYDMHASWPCLHARCMQIARSHLIMHLISYQQGHVTVIYFRPQCCALRPPIALHDDIMFQKFFFSTENSRIISQEVSMFHDRSDLPTESVVRPGPTFPRHLPEALASTGQWGRSWTESHDLPTWPTR